MCKTVILLKADGKIILKDGNNIDINFYYDHIKCRCINIAPVNHVFNDIEPLDKSLLVFDDEFLLNDEPIVNPMASLLFGYLEHRQTLCGNVILVKEDGEECVGFDDNEILKLTIFFKSLREFASNIDFVIQEPYFEINMLD